MKIDLKKDWKFFGILVIVIIVILLISGYTLSIKNKLYTKGELQEATGVIEKIEQGTRNRTKLFSKGK